jgi:hypothetical protein
MNRPSPLDLALGSLMGELTGVRDALARAGVDARRYHDFARNPEVQRLLGRLQSPELVARKPEAAGAYLAVLYAAYRFWEAGGEVVAPSRERLEPAFREPPPPDAPAIPGGACYLQLPHHWFWARVTPDGPHEPLDGCFLAADGSGAEVTVVAVLGLHPGRHGFTQIALHVPAADFAAASEAAGREFAPTMESGDAAGFRSVTTAGELLLLVRLALALPAR